MLVAAPLLAPVPASAQARAAAPYKAPRLSYGQPSLEGYWTNGSLTPESREPEFGDRLVLTPEEVAKIESEAGELATSDNGSIDPNAPAPSVGGDLPPGQTQFTAAGGNVGGYDRGWLDPGAHVMRVGGEPRTSFLTTPNGRPPARKAQPAAAAGAAAPARAAGGARPSAFDNPETRVAGRALPDQLWPQRPAADAAQRLLQQQLPVRSEPRTPSRSWSRWCTTRASSG